MLALLFGAISLLYATVGQAGGTSFLALMALASYSPGTMRPTALMLNIVASSYSTWVFNRGRSVDWAKLRPLLVSSLPTALVGGLIVLDERLYKTVTGLVLLPATMVLASRKAQDEETDRPTQLLGAIIIGAAVGFAPSHGLFAADPSSTSAIRLAANRSRRFLLIPEYQVGFAQFSTRT